MGTEEAAAACGVGQSAYSKWENGRTRPGDEYLDAIARFLDMTTAEVILARSAEYIEDMAAERIARLEEQLQDHDARLAEMNEAIRRLKLPPDT